MWLRCVTWQYLPHHISVRWAFQLLLHWKQSTDLSWTLSMTWEWQYQACNPALRNCAMQNRPIAATNAGITCRISLLFFLQIAKWHFYIFSIFEIGKNFDTAALLFSLFFLISCKLLWHSCTFIFFILNFLLFYVYSLYFRYNLLLWYYLLVQ